MVGLGPGFAPIVEVFAGGTLLNPQPSLLGSPFDAFAPTFSGGVNVATGDLANNGYSEIITTVASTGPPVVSVFNGYEAGYSLIRSFYAFNSTNILGGLTLAVGAVVGAGGGPPDGTLDIIVGSSPGYTPYLAVFSAASVLSGGTVEPVAADFVSSSNFHGEILVMAEPDNGGNPWIVQPDIIFVELLPVVEDGGVGSPTYLTLNAFDQNTGQSGSTGSSVSSGTSFWGPGTSTLTGATAPPLAVSGVSPSFGPATGGTTVTISGTDLNTATAIYFGSSAATSFTIVSSTQITAVSPTHAPGTIDITVIGDGIISPITSADQFNFDLIDVWTGDGTDDNWDTPQNCSAGVPTAAYTVVINNARFNVNLQDSDHVTISNLVLSAGTITGAGSINVTGQFDWTGGSLSGSGSTTAQQVILDGASTMTLAGWTLTSTSSTLWESGQLVETGGAKFYNQGLFTTEGSGLSWSADADSGITNSGAMTFAMASPVSVSGAGTLTESDGTLDISGITDLPYLIITDGSATISSALTLTDLNVSGGSLTVKAVVTENELTNSGGSITVDADMSLANFSESAGTLANNAMVDVTGNVTFTGGTTIGEPINIFRAFNVSAVVALNSGASYGTPQTTNITLQTLQQRYDLQAPAAITPTTPAAPRRVSGQRQRQQPGRSGLLHYHAQRQPVCLGRQHRRDSGRGSGWVPGRGGLRISISAARRGEPQETSPWSQPASAAVP